MGYQNEFVGAYHVFISLCRDVSFQAIAWTHTLMKSKFSHFYLFSAHFGGFHTLFQFFFLQVSLHPCLWFRGIYFSESVDFFPTYFTTSLNFFPISHTHFIVLSLISSPISNLTEFFPYTKSREFARIYTPAVISSNCLINLKQVVHMKYLFFFFRAHFEPTSTSKKGKKGKSKKGSKDASPEAPTSDVSNLIQRVKCSFVKYSTVCTYDSQWAVMLTHILLTAFSNIPQSV